MISLPTEMARLWYWKVEAGEDILHALEREVSSNGIHEGTFLSGIGSVSRWRVHVVKSTNLPPGNTIVEATGPFDLNSVSGMVLDGRVHAHVCLSDTKSTISGHLEDRTIALTFCSVLFMETKTSSSLQTLDDFPGKP